MQQRAPSLEGVVQRHLQVVQDELNHRDSHESRHEEVDDNLVHQKVRGPEHLPWLVQNGVEREQVGALVQVKGRSVHEDRLGVQRQEQEGQRRHQHLQHLQHDRQEEDEVGGGLVSSNDVGAFGQRLVAGGGAGTHRPAHCHAQRKIAGSTKVAHVAAAAPPPLLLLLVQLALFVLPSLRQHQGADALQVVQLFVAIHGQLQFRFDDGGRQWRGQLPVRAAEGLVRLLELDQGDVVGLYTRHFALRRQEELQHAALVQLLAGYLLLHQCTLVLEAHRADDSRALRLDGHVEALAQDGLGCL